MRKFALLAAALAVTAGAASVSIACDHDKASSTSSASSSASKEGCGNTATGSNAALISSDGGSCAAHKNASAGSCAAKGKNASAMTAAECKNMKCEDAVFSVADMHGECCVDGVSNALASVKGVHGVRVDYAQHKAYVCTAAASKLDRKAVTKSLQKAGFTEVSFVGVDKTHCMHMASAKSSDGTKTTTKTSTSKV